LFNILQEGDIQIRGYKVRLPLDMQFVFTANPEDYTNRGSIVTPLKDRIGSQILTHYPESLEIAKKITEQEAKLNNEQSNIVHIPALAKDLLEQISFEARESEYIDHKSGVSARMSITAYENLISTTERRALKTGVEKTTLRLSDFMGIIPAITGKVELVYEGEQEGAAFVAQKLITDSIATLFPNYFPKVEKLEKDPTKSPYNEMIEWFMNQPGIELLDEATDEEYRDELDSIKPLDELVKKYNPKIPAEDAYFLKEFLLWGLVEYKKLSKDRFVEGFQFSELFGNTSKSWK
jgi:magnesium chelatase subunit I